MKRIAGLAALAVVTVAGLAPATALSPQRALASASRASSSASVPGGTQLWAANYHGNAQMSHAVAAASSPDGATAYVTGLTGLAHFSTLAYNAATGAARWMATFYGRGYSQPSAMAVSPDGSKLFVTGFTTPPGACCADQFVTVAYDAATGTRLWVARTFSIVNVGSLATAVTVGPDGSTVFAAGSAGEAGLRDGRLRHRQRGDAVVPVPADGPGPVQPDPCRRYRHQPGRDARVRHRRHSG
jgi:DNA-binding beta-propeller fold protein YncE